MKVRPSPPLPLSYVRLPPRWTIYALMVFTALTFYGLGTMYDHPSRLLAQDATGATLRGVSSCSRTRFVTEVAADMGLQRTDLTVIHEGVHLAQMRELGCKAFDKAMRDARALLRKTGLPAFRSAGHGRGPLVSVHLGVSPCWIRSSSEYCEAHPPPPRMKPKIGTAYQFAPGLYVGLARKGRAVVVKAHTDEDGDVGAEEAPCFGVFPRSDHGQCMYASPEEAIQHGETHPEWVGKSVRDALFEIHEYLFNPPPLDYAVLIELMGHRYAYALVPSGMPEQFAAYWEAAATLEATPSTYQRFIKNRLDYWSQWALRLGALHGRPLSSMEMVALCTSPDQATREFALTATASVSNEPDAPSPRAGSRRRS